MSSGRAPRRRTASAALVLVLLIAGTWSCSRDDELPAPVASSSVRSSVIDLPAADRFVPPEAVLDVRARFGAVGDGLTDDTDALQRAISAAIGLESSHKVVYLPAGVYRVTRPLEWRRPSGQWATSVTVVGQNRDRTVVQLADAAPGFTDGSRPRSVIVTGSQNSDDGAGNQAFNNFVLDLTVDVGRRNPGANGVDYLANNRGALRNVVVRAPPDSGHTGISMTRPWPGPALLQDVRVVGFDRGIVLANYQYSITMEDVRLVDQRTQGILNVNNTVSIRGLESAGTATVIANGVAGAAGGLLTLLDARMAGRPGDAAAIENHGTALLRRVETTGFTRQVLDARGAHDLPADGSWTSAPALSALGAPAPPLDLPVADEPAEPSYPASEWAAVSRFGAVPDDGVDDTAAVQAALDTRKPAVHLTPGVYRISRTLRVPTEVRRIEGFEAFVDATALASTPPRVPAVFDVEGDSREAVSLALMTIKSPAGTVKVGRSGGRALVLRDLHFTGAGEPFRGGPGRVFLNDVDGGGSWTFGPGQQVWARQLNAEQPTVKINNVGADLWILGLKTEESSTVLTSSGRARTEILGALLYPATAVDAVPAFATDDAALSATFTVVGGDPTHRYPVHVAATCDGVTHRIGEESVGRGPVALYSHQRCQ